MVLAPKEEINVERKRLIIAIGISLFISLLMLLVHLLQLTFPDMTRALALYPRKWSGALGILTAAFLHADWVHFFNNIVTFIVLSSLLFYMFRGVAFQIFVQLWIYSGLILWIIGRPSYHIGASGLIFSMAFFLFVSGIIRHNRNLLAISLMIVFLYGGMIWQLFPWEATYKISWESHLSGAIVGVILALLYRKQGPQTIEPDYEDDPDDDNPYWDTQENSNDNVV